MVTFYGIGALIGIAALLIGGYGLLWSKERWLSLICLGIGSIMLIIGMMVLFH